MKAVVIVVVVVIALALLYTASTYNALVKLKSSVDEAFSTMDVYLKKRWDLIPNIVASVKGYAKHEADTLLAVVEARNSRYQDMSIDDKLEADKAVSRSMASINALAEQYPDLKANANFINLNNQLQRSEEDIANSRKYYNAVVRNYNNKVEMFPSRIIASMFKFRKSKMFEAPDDSQRENIKVEF